MLFEFQRNALKTSGYDIPVFLKHNVILILNNMKRLLYWHLHGLKSTATILTADLKIHGDL